MSKEEFLEYELAGSDWWASFVGIDFLQMLAGKYFAWKVNRKHAALLRCRRRAMIVRHFAKHRIEME